MDPTKPKLKDPEHPPIGKDHVMRPPEGVPPVIPLSRVYGNRCSLLYVASFALLGREDLRAWLVEFRKSRASTPSGASRGCSMHFLAETREAVEAALRHNQVPKRPITHGGVYRAHSREESSAISSGIENTRSEVDAFLYGPMPHTGRILTGITRIEAEMSLKVPPHSGGDPNVFLTGEAGLRAIAGGYDEVFVLCLERDLKRFTRRYGRRQRHWVIPFPDTPPA